jgi:hypothetical protein
VSEVLRCAFLLVVPARGWTVEQAVHGGLRLKSPRTSGTMHFSAVPMPEELGSYDIAKLWARAEPHPVATLREARFDETEWSDGPVHGIAFSSRWNTRTMTPPWAVAANLAEMMIAAGLPVQDPEFEPTHLNRDWCLARENLVVDINYWSVEKAYSIVADGTKREVGNPLLAEDLLDCEEMVRGARFDEPP